MNLVNTCVKCGQARGSGPCPEATSTDASHVFIEVCYPGPETIAVGEAPAASHENGDEDRIYPCSDCGAMRTKAEGGTVFTVCDKCWEKIYPPVVLEDDPLWDPGKSPERYWCGCVRHARWERCDDHSVLGHDEEPPAQRGVTASPEPRAWEVWIGTAYIGVVSEKSDVVGPNADEVTFRPLYTEPTPNSAAEHGVRAQRGFAMEVIDLQAEIRALREALEPLARVADLIPDTVGDDDAGLWSRSSSEPGESYTLTVGHARAARTALAEGSTNEQP